MKKAQKGDKVKVHYTGKLDDGTVFDSSRDREPLTFTLGNQELIPGFEKGVEGMEPGESKTVHIPSKEAYGPVNDNLVFSIPREQLPEELDPTEGQRLQIPLKDGGFLMAVVTQADDEGITLDANHELAGEDLNFEIELVEFA